MVTPEHGPSSAAPGHARSAAYRGPGPTRWSLAALAARRRSPRPWAKDTAVELVPRAGRVLVGRAHRAVLAIRRAHPAVPAAVVAAAEPKRSPWPVAPRRGPTPGRCWERWGNRAHPAHRARLARVGPPTVSPHPHSPPTARGRSGWHRATCAPPPSRTWPHPRRTVAGRGDSAQPTWHAPFPRWGRRYRSQTGLGSEGPATP
jgi:hypothetical protein